MNDNGYKYQFKELTLNDKIKENINIAINQLEGDELKVICLLAEKMVAGKEKYGSWKAAQDSRNYFQEASEEVLDALNYIAMQLIKAKQKSEFHLNEPIERVSNDY